VVEKDMGLSPIGKEVEEMLKENNRVRDGCRSTAETSATPGFHREGRQNRIDDALKIEQSDLFIGIMRKKFGTPVHDAGSGTEHEFQLAYRAYLASDNDKPQIFFTSKT
jgi:hypothetical protein